MVGTSGWHQLLWCLRENLIHKLNIREYFLLRIDLELEIRQEDEESCETLNDSIVATQ